MHKAKKEDVYKRIKKTKRGCWEWLGAIGKDGYGLTCVDSKTQGAHRVSWEATNGEIPKGLWVLHKCDNPKCINPKHLFLGTAKDNTKDSMQKGRRKFRGEDNPSTKLTNTQREEIFLRYIPRSRVHGAHALAKIYKVSYAAILHNIRLLEKNKQYLEYK